MVGCLTNEALPQLVHLTTAVDVTPPAGIVLQDADAPAIVDVYTTSGLRTPTDARGIRICRMSDGTTRKMLR